MSKLPGFMFYPGDWSKDPNLKRTTRSEKGLLMDLLCLMFESKERGVLVTGGVPWEDDEIVHAVGGDPSGTLFELTELVRKGVLSRRNDGALFSRRLVREEEIRLERSKAGSLGGRPTKYQKQNGVVEKSKLKANHKANTKQITEYENENERVVKKLETKNKANYEDVREFCIQIELSEQDAEWLFDKWEGSGWKNNGRRILDWKATARSWKRIAIFPSQRVNGKPRVESPPGKSIEELAKEFGKSAG